MGGVDRFDGAGKLVGTMEAFDPAINSWGAAPSPLAISFKLAHGSIKAGQKQMVAVTTAPSVRVTILVSFPDGSKKTKDGTATSTGQFTWSFKEPPGKAKGQNRTVKVTVTVASGSKPPKSASKHYKIT